MMMMIIEGGKFGKWLTESLFFLRATTTKIIVMKVFYYARFKLSLENVAAPHFRILPTKNQRSLRRKTNNFKSSKSVSCNKDNKDAEPI